VLYCLRVSIGFGAIGLRKLKESGESKERSGDEGANVVLICRDSFNGVIVGVIVGVGVGVGVGVVNEGTLGSTGARGVLGDD